MDSQYDRDTVAMVLAGGDGMRPRVLAYQAFGQDKHFRKVDQETLSERTLRRVSLIAPRERTLSVLTRARERLYSGLLIEPRVFLLQPANCGTTSAIMSTLIRLEKDGCRAAIAIFPSDPSRRHRQE